MNLLALGHEASRTGAPILLRELLRWLTRQQRSSVRCLIKTGGCLKSEFESICSTQIFDEASADSVLERVPLARRLCKPAWERWLRNGPVDDLIYVNTVAAIPLLQIVRPLLPPKTPVVIHIHELESHLRQFDRSNQIQSDLHEANLILAASEAVKSALVKEFGLPADRVEVVYEWLCLETDSESDHAATRSMIRSKLCIPPDSQICLGSGSLIWRKAPELIPMIAKLCQKDCPDLHFVWMGQQRDDRTFDQFSLDAKRLGVETHVHFVGEVSEPAAYFRAADVFSLVSREDPYPLVMLEAAAHGLPVICFAQSGGAPEFVSRDTGIVVPYLDTSAYAQALIQLLQAPEQAQQLGANGQQYVTQHHSLDHAATQIDEILNRILIAAS